MDDIADAVRGILRSAEDAAAAIRADAGTEARRRAEETERRLTDLWRERSSAIHRLTDSVVTQGKALEAQIEELRMQAGALSSTMREAIQSLRAEVGVPEDAPLGEHAADDPRYGPEPDTLREVGESSPPGVTTLRKWLKGEPSGP